jgi:O-antigen ligase
MSLVRASTWNLPLSTGVLIAAFGLSPLLVWALVTEQWKMLAGLILVALVPIVVRLPVVSTFGLYALLACSLDALPLLEGMTLTKPVGVLTGAALLGAGLVERRLRRPPPAALWWGLFIVLAIVSAAWAIDPDETLGRLTTTLSLFFLYLVAVSFRPSRKELHWVCVLTVVGGVLAASGAYLFGLNEEETGKRARGTIAIGDQRAENPNTLGRVLVLPLSLAIAGFIGLRRSLQRMIAVGCVGLIGVGIYISMSRAALLAMVVMISVLIYRLRARWQIIAAMVVLLALVTVMPDKFYERTGALATGADSTGSGRTEIWEIGLEALARYGLIGAGLDNFPEVFLQYTPYKMSAHNTYLMVGVELGIIGLALLLAALASHLLAAWRARGVGRGAITLAALEGACFGMLTSAMFADVLYRKIFWLTWIRLTWAVYCEQEPLPEKQAHYMSDTSVSRG